MTQFYKNIFLSPFRNENDGKICIFLLLDSCFDNSKESRILADSFTECLIAKYRLILGKRYFPDSQVIFFSLL